MNKPMEGGVETLSFWINGAKQPGAGGRHGVTNPATGVVIRRVPFANGAEVDGAVQAAKTAFPEWRAAPPR